eukprot:3807269-Pyramimonas_sp.AAC.1
MARPGSSAACLPSRSNGPSPSCWGAIYTKHPAPWGAKTSVDRWRSFRDPSDLSKLHVNVSSALRSQVRLLSGHDVATPDSSCAQK